MNYKIFISSPEDVMAERDVAERVINRLAKDKEIMMRRRLQVVRWDKSSEGVVLDARISPEAAVNRKLLKPSDCDLVLVILGSRMGTPLDASYKRKVDGSPFLSGTEWEYYDAIEARGPDGKPAVWVYHHKQAEAADGEIEAEQLKNVKSFIERICANGEGGVNFYKSIGDFEEKFEAGLRAELLGKQRAFNVPAFEDGATYVGRKEQIEHVLKELIEGKNQALVYIPGVGKTTMACKIARRKEWLDKSAGVLWADVGKDSDRQSVMESWAVALEIPDEKRATLGGVEEWRAAVRHEIASRPNLLIVLDDVWSLKDGLQFFELGKNCTFLMTTRNRRIAHQLCGNNVVDIEPLSGAESLELLEALAPTEIAAAREKFSKQLSGIVECLDGLPIALEMTGKYLRGEWNPAVPQRLERALLKLQKAGVLFAGQDQDIDDWASLRLVPLYETYYESLDNDELRRAARAMSAFRPNPHHFTPAMAEEILSIHDSQLQRLENAGFVKLTGDGRCSMHRTISEFAFAKCSPNEGQAWHAKILEYYQRKLNHIADELDPDPFAYASWYQYESPEWQELQLARLYHLAAAHPEGDVAIATAIVRIYLHAFWWWGYYQPFAFCDALIEDWEMRTQAPRLRSVFETLREFGKNYPEGYEKKNKAGWPVVRACLLTLRRELGLDRAVDEMSLQNRHTRAFMDFFLAEAYAFGQDGDLTLALQTYESARSSFEVLGDTWNASWLLFYMADLVKDIGNTNEERAANRATARTYCMSSIRLAENMSLLKRDPEVLGNAYRVLGDISFAAGDYPQTEQDDFHATGYAYAFQGIPNPPDTYTAEFFHEIKGRVSARIAELIAIDPTAGRGLRDGLKTRWAPYVETGQRVASAEVHETDPTTAEAIAAYIFPAPPEGDDLHDGKLAFQTKVRDVVSEAMLKGI